MTSVTRAPAGAETRAQQIGANITRRRKARKQSSAELARATGMQQGQLWRYESGRVEPQLETLERLAAALGCNVQDLLPRRRAA